MLGTKEELGSGAFGEMYVYLQLAAKTCCSTLPLRMLFRFSKWVAL